MSESYKSMHGVKYLIKNIGLLTISSFGTKLLSFFLVPLYTNVLTTNEYGTYDLLNTTIAVLVPLLTLNIADAVMRFPLDGNCDPPAILRIGFRYFFIGFVPLFIFVVIDYWFNFLPILHDYSLFFILLYAVTGLNGIITSYARGIEKIAALSISGIISTLTIIVLNILLLVVFPLGINGYFIANIIGIAAQTLYLLIATKAWKTVGVSSSKDLTTQREMTAYSVPLMANTLAWWVNNSSARYIVTWLRGLSENGILSVSYKIPSILSIFQTIFMQAWTISATKDFDPDDKKGFFSRVYNYYNFAMTVVCSLLIVTARLLASFLYAKEFYIAWKCVPFLLISILFGAVSGYLGGIFAAVKDSKSIASTTLAGAAINLVFDFALVYFIGTVGAAIANMISYWFVWAIRVRLARRHIKLGINLFRDYVAYFILLVQSALLLLVKEDLLWLYLFELLLFFFILYLYKAEAFSLYNSALQVLKSKKQEKRKL